MATPRTLSFLNLLIVALNFVWIASLENELFFSFSFTDTIELYPSYLTPAKFTYKIWSFIGLIMIIAAYMMYKGSIDNDPNSTTVKKVEKIDYLLILNQLALGLSMTLKHNDYFICSIIFSTVCLISIFTVNRRIQIRRLTSNSITRYFIRLGFGIYTGWIMFVLAFNATTILSKYSIQLGDQLFFYLNVCILILISIAMILYSYFYFLPTVSAVLVWGCYGIYYQINLNPISEYYNIKPYTIFAMILGIIFTAYNYYRCSERRKELIVVIQEPPSIS